MLQSDRSASGHTTPRLSEVALPPPVSTWLTILMMKTKAELRRLAQMLSESTEKESAAVVSHLVKLIPARSSVCIYLPMPGEVDVTGLMQDHQTGEFFTTRTGSDLWLTVHPIDVVMETHPYGYRQPVAGALRVDTETIDVFVVPGAAFDLLGNRLGHGMGYYDRLLSKRHHDASLIGVTTDRRVFPAIPTDEFDIPMDLVVTESGEFSPGSGRDEG